MQVFGYYLNDCGQNLFKEKREYNFLLLNDRELEIGADGNDTMEDGAKIGTGIEKGDQVVEGNPCFVLIADDGGEDFPVDFDEHVVLRA